LAQINCARLICLRGQQSSPSARLGPPRPWKSDGSLPPSRRCPILLSNVVLGFLDQASNEGLEVGRNDDDAIVILLVDVHDLRLTPLSAGPIDLGSDATAFAGTECRCQPSSADDPSRTPHERSAST